MLKTKFSEVKKYIKSDNIIAFFFIACLMIGFISGIVGKIENILVKSGYIKDDSEYVKKIDIDWEKKYPFENEKEIIDTREESNKFLAGINKYESKAQAIISKFEGIAEYTAGYYILLEINGYVNKITGRKDFVAQKGKIRLDDGRIIDINKKLTQEETDLIAERVIDLEKYVNELGIKFMYVGELYKVGRNENLPAGIETFVNDNYDNFLERIKSEGIDYLDLRDMADSEGLDVSTMFYKTDHHWKAETGLWAAKCVTENVANSYGYNMDYSLLESNKYDIITYENSWIGSMGRSLTLGYCDLEDFNIAYPKEEYNLKVNYPDLKLELTGNFTETLINWERFENIEDYYNNSLYESYAYGCRPLTCIQNLDSNNEIKILTINDSFGLTLAPYLSLVADEVHMIDFRAHNGNFNGSVRKYIEEYRPDIVLLTYMPETYFLDRLR